MLLLLLCPISSSASASVVTGGEVCIGVEVRGGREGGALTRSTASAYSGRGREGNTATWILIASSVGEDAFDKRGVEVETDRGRGGEINSTSMIGR